MEVETRESLRNAHAFAAEKPERVQQQQQQQLVKDEQHVKDERPQVDEDEALEGADELTPSPSPEPSFSPLSSSVSTHTLCHRVPNGSSSETTTILSLPSQVYERSFLDASSSSSSSSSHVADPSSAFVHPGPMRSRVAGKSAPETTLCACCCQCAACNELHEACRCAEDGSAQLARCCRMSNHHAQRSPKFSSSASISSTISTFSNSSSILSALAQANQPFSRSHSNSISSSRSDSCPSTHSSSASSHTLSLPSHVIITANAGVQASDAVRFEEAAQVLAASTSDSSPVSRSDPADEQLVAFSALLYRCLTNRRALQCMLDCGCLESHISEQTRPRLSVDTSSPSTDVATPESRLSSISSSNSSGARFKTPVLNSATHSHRPPNSLPTASSSPPAHSLKRKPNSGTPTGKRKKTDLSSLPEQVLLPGLVRANTEPGNDQGPSIMNSPRHDPVAKSVVVSKSPRRGRVKAGTKSKRTRTGISRSQTAAAAVAATSSAPNTPHPYLHDGRSQFAPMSARGPVPSHSHHLQQHEGLLIMSGSGGLGIVQDDRSPMQRSMDSDIRAGSSMMAMSPCADGAMLHSDQLLPSLVLTASNSSSAVSGSSDHEHDNHYPHEYLLQRRKSQGVVGSDTMGDLGMGISHHYRPRTFSETQQVTDLAASNSVFAVSGNLFDDYLHEPVQHDTRPPFAALSPISSFQNASDPAAISAVALQLDLSSSSKAL